MVRAEVGIEMRSQTRLSKNNLPLRDEEGQSTVEFALTIILLMSLVFFFLQVSLVFGVGNYIHYATFMSARAYLSAGPNGDDQRDRAKSVIISTLKQGILHENQDRFETIARAEGGTTGLTGLDFDSPQFQKGVPSLSWLQGVRYTFRSRLFLFPMGFQKFKPGSSGANTVKLTSESWLGREPADDACEAQLRPKFGIYDNGC